MPDASTISRANRPRCDNWALENIQIRGFNPQVRDPKCALCRERLSLHEKLIAQTWCERKRVHWLCWKRLSRDGNYSCPGCGEHDETVITDEDDPRIAKAERQASRSSREELIRNAKRLQESVNKQLERVQKWEQEGNLVYRQEAYKELVALTHKLEIYELAEQKLLEQETPETPPLSPEEDDELW